MVEVSLLIYDLNYLLLTKTLKNKTVNLLEDLQKSFEEDGPANPFSGTFIEEYEKKLVEHETYSHQIRKLFDVATIKYKNEKKKMAISRKVIVKLKTKIDCTEKKLQASVEDVQLLQEKMILYCVLSNQSEECDICSTCIGCSKLRREAAAHTKKLNIVKIK